jgi:hypothetical protein
MENNQNVQQERSPATAITQDKVKRKSKSTDSSMLVIHLLARYPWLLLVGLLGMFLGSATLAVYSLSYAGRVEPQEPEPIAEVAQPINTPSETSNPTPLWMVAAIALSCASGSLIILRLLNRPTQRQKDQKQINRYETRLARRRHQKLEPHPPENPRVFVPPSQSTSFAPVPSKTKPMVTVLPPEYTIPFDKSKESLADMLDIRKQSSLSAILRK